MLPAELIINSARAVLFRSTFPVCLFLLTPRKLPVCLTDASWGGLGEGWRWLSATKRGLGRQRRVCRAVLCRPSAAGGSTAPSEALLAASSHGVVPEGLPQSSASSCSFCRCSRLWKCFGCFWGLQSRRTRVRYQQKRAFWGQFVGCVGLFHLCQRAPS